MYYFLSLNIMLFAPILTLKKKKTNLIFLASFTSFVPSFSLPLHFLFPSPSLPPISSILFYIPPLSSFSYLCVCSFFYSLFFTIVSSHQLIYFRAVLSPFLTKVSLVIHCCFISTTDLEEKNLLL